MTRAAKTRAGAVRVDCPRCGAPTLHQSAGLPFVVTADDTRHRPAQAALLTGPDRLAWCLRESPWTGLRLVEVLPSVHSKDCPHAHVVDHQCPPGTPRGRRPEGTLW